MATIQLDSGHQGLYKSPYSCVSTYHKRSILDQGMKDTIRSDEFPRYNTTFSRHHVGVERTIIDLDSYADDGFIDRDEPLSDMQQRYITPEGAAEKMEIGSKSGSSAALSQRIEGSTQDLVMPSVSEFVSAKVEPNYRNLDVNLAAISDSDPLHNTSSDTADSNGLASGTTLTSDRTITDHQNDNDNGIVDNARPQLAAGLVRSTSLSYGSVTHQASPMPVNPEITHGNASYSDLDVIQEVENEVVNAFADDEDDADTCSTKRSDSSTISSHKSASDRNVFKLLASQHDSAQLP